MSVGLDARPAQRTLRRLISYALLFGLVVITAVGLSGLVGRLLGAGTVLAAGDVAGLARSLAFALIGGPLAAGMWWAVWRRHGAGAERASVGWGLYLAGTYALSLVVGTSNLLSTLAALIGGQPLLWRLSLATGLVWAGVWGWQRWMWRQARKRPMHLADLPTVFGAVYGLGLGVGGAVTALSGLLDAALRGADMAAVGHPWWVSVLQSLVWASGGALVWWLHWKHDGGQRLRTGLADVALIMAGVLGAGVLALSGAGVVLFAVLRLAFDRTDPMNELLDPLAPALAAAAIGVLVWAYHRGLAQGRAESTRQGGNLVTSGVALVAAASGVGVIVNAALAVAGAPIAGAGVRTLLLGGVSSLLVGGPVWWLAWKPLLRKPAAGLPPAGLGARRIYLIVVFGLSAVVAVIALLVIGFRMFEFFLEDGAGGSLVEPIRAPLGLLVATGLVAGYHFAVWRYDSAVPAASSAGPRTIGHVILVTGSAPAPLQRAIEEATGAGVTVWRRAEGLPDPVDAAQLPDRLAAALQGLSAKRVLVTVSPEGRIDAVPLLD